MNQNLKSGFGVASFVLSLIGLLTSCVGIGIIFAILAIIFGIIAIASKNQKSGLGIAGLVIGFIAFWISVAMLSAGDSGINSIIDNSSANVENSQSSDNKDSDSENSNSKDSSSEDDVVLVGGNFEVDGLKVTINSYDSDFKDYSEWNVPSDGYKYIAVSFTCENTGDYDKYISIYDYDCYADNTLCDQAYIGGDDFINANLSSGRNNSFTTYYSVPIDAENIELEYTANVWTDEKVTVKLQ